MNLAKPSQNLDVMEARFLANLADGGDFGGLARLDMTLWDSPAVFRILDQKNLNIFLVWRHPKNDTTRGRLANNFLNRGLFVEDFR